MTPCQTIDTASAQQVAWHLAACDTSFRPVLSDRVDLDAYAIKICKAATRFEAWSEGTLIGLVAAYCNGTAGAAAFVSNVSVVPHHTGQGIARRLLGACGEYAARAGFARLELEVHPDAQAALSLYRGLGFRAEDDGTASALRMRLDLPFGADRP